MSMIARDDLQEVRALIEEVSTVVDGRSPLPVIWAMSFLIGKIIADCAPDNDERTAAEREAIDTIKAVISGEYKLKPH